MTDLEKQELLDEAKRRYPVGTVFRVVHMPSIIKTVASHDYYKNTFIQNSINLLVVEKSECEGASVYAGGKWAEIISYPEGYTLTTLNEIELIL